MRNNSNNNIGKNGIGKSENGASKPRRKYDEEFKRSALKMVENGQSVRSVAQGLG